MEPSSIPIQTALANKSVDHDIQSLRDSFNHRDSGQPLETQVALVQSQTRILKRHLERLFALEEVDDYLNFTVSLHPHFNAQVEHLKAEHKEFRDLIGNLIIRLQELESRDEQRFAALCVEIHEVLCRVLAHGRAEGKLLAQAIDSDEGGEA